MLPAMPHLALFVAMALAGSVLPTSKIAAELPVFVAACARYGLASLILLPLAWPAWRRLPRLPRRDVLLLLAQAAAGSLGFSVMMLLSLRLTGAADASVVSGTLPAMMALLAVAFGERPSRRQWLAVGLATVGVAALTGAASWGTLAGNALALLAVLGEALFVTLNRRLATPVPPLLVAAMMSGLGCLFTLPLAVVALATERLPLQPLPWVAVAYHAGVPTVLGFVLWYWGAARVSGAEAGLFTAVLPASGAVLAWTLLGEPVTAAQGLGLALVLAAIVSGCRVSGRLRAAPPAPSHAAARH